MHPEVIHEAETLPLPEQMRMACNSVFAFVGYVMSIL